MKTLIVAILAVFVSSCAALPIVFTIAAPAAIIDAGENDGKYGNMVGKFWESVGDKISDTTGLSKTGTDANFLHTVTK